MVSVILVNHNYAKYLPEAIESVMRQTYRNFELIIIDGASTDDSRRVIYDYLTKYPDKITAVMKPSSGQAAAFNMGVEISRGDTIAFLDADDYYTDNKLEVVAKLHEKYNFVGNSRYVVKGDSIFPISAYNDDYDTRPMLLKKYGYIYTYALTTSCISMTKKLADKIFPMPEDKYTTFADCYVMVLAQYLDNIKYINDHLTYYRVHKKQETQRVGEHMVLSNYEASLYKRVLNDINHRLDKCGLTTIPCMSEDGCRQASRIANGYENMTRDFVIYGTGPSSYNYSNYIEKLGGRFLYAIDGDKNKWGKIWRGLAIYSPEEGIRRLKDNEIILIGSNYYKDEIKDVLISYGLKENDNFMQMKGIPLLTFEM